MKEEKVFEVDCTPLSYTRVLSNFKKNSQSRRLDYAGVLEPAFHSWQERPSYLNAIGSVDIDAPGEVD